MISYEVPNPNTIHSPKFKPFKNLGHCNYCYYPLNINFLKHVIIEKI